VYVPYYRHSPRYVRDVNITNVRNETTIINVVNNKTVVNVNNFRNYRGATSAPRDVMEHGRAVGPAWGKNDKAKLDQQWARAKPEQQVAFRPQGDAEAKPANGPKFDTRNQQQKWQTNAKPTGQAKAPEPQPQPQQQPEKNWANTGKPKSNVATASKPVTPNAIPLPPSSTAQKPAAPNSKSQDAAAEPKSNKRKNQQPAVITPTAAKPVQQPQPPQQEQTSKKSQWKAQQQPKAQAQQPQ